MYYLCVEGTTPPLKGIGADRFAGAGPTRKAVA